MDSENPFIQQVYVIIMVQDSLDHKMPLFSMEPIGVYENLHTALEYVEKLENLTTDSRETHYDILEFEIGEKPFFLEFLEKEQKIVEDTVMKAILKLMKKGLVDQLVGEDGQFYYTLTEAGKESDGNIPKNVKKFFKKGGEDSK